MTSEVSLGELGAAAEARDELRAASRAILGKAWSPERFRSLLDGDAPAFDADLWDTVRGLGWGDLLVGAEAGGGAASVPALMVLAEEVGAAAAPVPLATASVASWCEQRCVDGMPLALTQADAAASADGTRVSGDWANVPFGLLATRLVLFATTASGDEAVVSVSPDQHAVVKTPLRPLDHGPAAAIHMEDAEVDAVVAHGEPARLMRDAARRLATVATVAELTGVAAAASAAACEYAKERVAFDRPIGSYQAIKHRLVDQRAAIEVSRALVTRAADAIDRDHPDADALTALCAFWAVDSLRSVPEGAVQIFGGIGYTWDHVAHVHLRRAACLTAGLGARSMHRRTALDWLKRGHLPDLAP